MPYDVVVVGSGASGGLAARLLTERGLEVLLLEAGPDPTAPKGDRIAEPSKEDRGASPLIGGVAAKLFDRLRVASEVFAPDVTAMADLALGRPDPRAIQFAALKDAPKGTWRPERQPIQSQCRGFGPGTQSLYVDDVDHPYLTPAAQPYQWIRCRHLGGRTQIWKRVAPRMTSWELGAHGRDGLGGEWPVSQEDLRPHYEKVERIMRVVGAVEAGAERYPGALPQRPMTAIERQVKSAVEARFPERRVILAPFASPLGEGEDQRSLDERINGPTNGRRPTWDASVRHSLPFAMATGRLETRTNAIVREVVLDGSGRAKSVVFVDRLTRSIEEIPAKVVVLAASALESTRILMLSKIGASSGVLGRYLSDHLFGVGVVAFSTRPYEPQGFPDLYVPPFRNGAGDDERSFARSYQLIGEVRALRAGPLRRWMTTLVISGQGEVIPLRENRVSLDETIADAWGIPVLKIEYARSANELAMAEDILASAEEVARIAGFEVILRSMTPILPGASVHELGTARMGRDPNQSVLDPWCRVWEVPNLYVTDGAAFPSAGCQNPTLTIMALTSRACDDIVLRRSRGEL
jgi:choline dehydrogenase-like flavoprotein